MGCFNRPDVSPRTWYFVGSKVQIVIAVGGEAHVPPEARPHPVLHLVRRPQLPSVVQEELLLLLPLWT